MWNRCTSKTLFTNGLITPLTQDVIQKTHNFESKNGDARKCLSDPLCRIYQVFDLFLLSLTYNVNNSSGITMSIIPFSSLRNILNKWNDKTGYFDFYRSVYLKCFSLQIKQQIYLIFQATAFWIISYSFPLTLFYF